MPELIVTFAFSPGQRVVTPWGDMGIVSDASVNEEGGKIYFVARNRESQWLKENVLRPADEAGLPVKEA